VYFSTDPEPIRIHHYLFINIVSFLFGLLIFVVKLKYITIGFIVHIVEMIMLLIHVYHGGQILNISISVGYDIRVTCTFSVDKTINLHNLKRLIHFGLELLPNHFNISISAQINTDSVDLCGFFIVYLRLFLKKFEE
jgi:hypothetical protein